MNTTSYGHAPHRFDRLDAIAGEIGAIAEVPQHRERDFLVDAVVLRDQHPQRMTIGQPLAAAA